MTRAVALGDLMRKRRKRREPRGLAVFERAMFSVMGPPQLGENKPPEGYVPDEAANYCPKCGEHWMEHDRVDSGSFHYRQCPTAKV